MQSANGGWGAFDRDNTADFLKLLLRRSRRAARPADGRRHGPLHLVSVPDRAFAAAIRSCGAASHSCSPSRRRTVPGSAAGAPIMSMAPGRGALNAAGDMGAPWIRRAVELVARQNVRMAGWGEGRRHLLAGRTQCRFGLDGLPDRWAVLGRWRRARSNPAVARGVHHLVGRQRTGARWAEDQFTAVGFRASLPQISRILGLFSDLVARRYARLMCGNSRSVSFGIRPTPAGKTQPTQMATTRGVQACGITV